MCQLVTKATTTTIKTVSSVSSSQTDDITRSEMGSNTTEQNSIEVQTEEIPAPLKPEVDDEKLAEWLKRIYPQVHKELAESANSRAFRGYRVTTDTSDITCKLVQNINIGAHTKDAQIGSYVSAMSWNSTNTTLGVSCTYKHQSWCYHEGLVAFFTLNRDDFLPDCPKLKITTEACVMVLEFHPVLPAIVAAGLFTGDIVLWNIQKEQEDVVVKVNGHADGITQLSWIGDLDSPKNHLLASSSLDGYISVWGLNLSQSKLAIKERHQIKSQLFPKGDSAVNKKTIIRGVICFDFSKFAQDMFIVGAEGGMVVQCSRIGGNQLPGTNDDVKVLDSSYKYYESHKGELNSVSFSPNRNDMFMTSASDSEIRIYMLGQEEPAQTIFLKNTIYTICWVPFEEKLVVACGTAGLLEIFHLIKGKAVENTTKDKVTPKVLTTLRINGNKSGIVAVGTDDGQIQMWRVPWARMENLAL